MLLGCCLHFDNDCYLMLTLRNRQAEIVVTVSSPESDNSDKLLLSHTLRVSIMKKAASLHHCPTDLDLQTWEKANSQANNKCF
jgi:hypothetical protein